MEKSFYPFYWQYCNLIQNILRKNEFCDEKFYDIIVRLLGYATIETY